MFEINSINYDNTVREKAKDYLSNKQQEEKDVSIFQDAFNDASKVSTPFSTQETNDVISGYEDPDKNIIQNPDVLGNLSEIGKESPNDLKSEDPAINDVRDGNCEYTTTHKTDANGNSVEERVYANGVTSTTTYRRDGTTETYIQNPATGYYVKETDSSTRGIYREMGNENTGDYESEQYYPFYSIYNNGIIRHAKGNTITGDYESESKGKDFTSTTKGNSITGDYEYNYEGTDGSRESEKYNSNTGVQEYYNKSADGTETIIIKNSKTQDYEKTVKHNDGSIESQKYDSKTGFTEDYVKSADGSETTLRVNEQTGDYETIIKTKDKETHKTGNTFTGEFEYTEKDSSGKIIEIKNNPETNEFVQTTTNPDGTVIILKGNDNTGDYEKHTDWNDGDVTDETGNLHSGEYTRDTKYSDGKEKHQTGNRLNGDYEYTMTYPDGTVEHKKGNENSGEFELEITYPDGTVKKEHS